MSLLQELRRRSVFRVAAAYAIVAWLLIQIAVSVFPTLQLPAWTATLVTVLLIIGFPVALVLAWAFELTPEGVRRQPTEREKVSGRSGFTDYALMAGLFALIVLVGLQYFRPGAEPGAPPANREGRPSIAVLPFTDMSADASQQHFGDGIADELLNELARLDAIDVASRTSSFAFRDSPRPVTDIGRELGVQTVLEGSVRESDGQLRIIAQLIDVQTGFHLYSQTYNRELTDIFALQQDIAAQVAGALGVQFGVEGANAFQGAGTSSVEAYEAYLRALVIPDRAEREAALERVVEMDPNYANAWAQLGLAAGTEVWEVPPADMPRVLAVARGYVERAVAIDPMSAAGHSLLGTVLYAQKEWSEGQQAHSRAINLNPSDDTFMQNGLLNFRAGRSRIAIAQWNAARSISNRPDEIADTQFRVFALLGLRQYDEVERLMDELAPANGRDVALLLAMSRDDKEEVRTALESIETPAVAVITLYEPLLEVFDDRDEALRLLHDVASGDAVWPSRWHEVGRLAAWYGDTALAFTLAAEEARGGEPRSYGLWLPYMREVRQLPEFKTLMEEINLVEFWREFGWGDYCEPVGNDDFECS